MKLYLIVTVITIVTIAIFQKMSQSALRAGALSYDSQAVSNASENQMLTVSISGQVELPGVYQVETLSALSRLLALAGGVTSNADASCYNENVLLNNGDSIYIAPKGENKVSLNQGTSEEFLELPGIGITYANRIIDFRTEQGEFTKLEDITKISGIGTATFDRLKDRICL